MCVSDFLMSFYNTLLLVCYFLTAERKPKSAMAVARRGGDRVGDEFSVVNLYPLGDVVVLWVMLFAGPCLLSWLVGSLYLHA
jgi:hypothetical protein